MAPVEDSNHRVICKQSLDLGIAGDIKVPEETELAAKKPTLSAMPVKGRKKLKVKPLTEEAIEDVLVDKEAARVSSVHFTSSLKDADLSFTYEAVTDWGEFNVSDLVDKMVLFSSKLNGVPLYDYQLELQKRIFESVLLSDGEEITGLFSRQSGKCFAQGTMIRMYPSGTKRIEAIKVGDTVMGPDSRPRRVLSLASGKEEMFEVVSREKNHPSFTVNKSHILSVKDRKGRVLNISVADYIKLPRWKKADEYRGYRVPLEYKKKPLQVEPYWLGLWMGDGNERDQQITSMDQEVVEYLKEYSTRLGLYFSKYQTPGRCASYSIVSNKGTSGCKGVSKKDRKNPLKSYLRERKLLLNKHIPDEVMYNCREVRLQFLAGLVDSDGHRSTRPGKEAVCEISSCSQNLADQYVDLLRSLGFRASVKKGVTNFGTLKYRVTAYGDFSVVPTKIKRKQWSKPKLRENPLTFGFDLVSKGIGDYYGFTLEQGDKLFVLADHTVTHNTETLAQTCNTLLVLIPLLARIFPEQLGRFKRGFRIGLFAPTNEQAYTTHSRMDLRLSDEDADAIMSDSDINAQKKYNNGVLQITGADEQLPSGKIIPSFRSFCKVQSAAKQTKIESKTYDLILIDEAQEVDTMKVQKCFVEGTPINRPDGTTDSIEFIVQNKLSVLTPDGVSQPSAFIDGGEQACKTFTLDNGRVLTTSLNHEHLVVTRTKRTPFKVLTKDLSSEHRVAIPDELPYFGHEGTFEEGLLLGSLLGDGSFTMSPPQFCGSEEYISLLEPIVESMGCRVNRHTINRENGLIECTFPSRTTWRNPISSWLKTIGVYSKTGAEKYLPDLPYSKECARGVIQGLIETDGCVEEYSKKPIISFANISEKLVRGLQDQLLKFGVHSRVFSKPNNGSLGVAPKPLWVLHIKDVESIRRFSERIGLQLKNDKLIQACATIAPKMSRNKSVSYPPKFRFQKIVRLEDAGVRQTYCVTVPTDEHLILANGIVSGNSIHPMVSATNGTIVKIGTCTTFRSDFYDATIRNKRKYIKNNIKNHFEFDYKTCQRYNKYYKSWVTKERERIGEDSDAFRMAFRLEWLIEKGMAITPQMYEEYLKVPGNRFEYAPIDGATYVAGLDLGKENDSTVMTIARIEEDPTHLAKEDENQDKFIKTVVNWIEMIGDNWEVQFETVVSAVRTYGIKVLTVDSTGVGDVIYDRLERVLEDEDVVLIPVIFNLKEKHAMATLFYEELRAMRIRIPAHQSATKTKRHQNFLMQFYACEKVYNKSFMQLKHGDDKDAHDDFVDSLLLMCYGVEQNLTPRVRSSDNFMRHGGSFREDTHRSRRFEKAISQYKRVNAANWRRYNGK